MLRHKGFTLVELLIVIAIIAILGAVLIPMINGGAHGMELNTYMEPSDGNILAVAKAIRTDPHQTVTVLSYAVKWDHNLVDRLMDKNREIQNKLLRAGVAKHKIVFGMANADGLKYDGIAMINQATALPPKDGVYLYLD